MMWENERNETKMEQDVIIISMKSIIRTRLS